MSISFIKGDVTNSNVKGFKILPHVCNSRNSFGSGVAYGILKKWPIVKQEYHKWYETQEFDLGENQYVIADEDTIVVNMIAQKLGTDTIMNKDIPPIRLWALKECMMRMVDFCESFDKPFTIICPKFGSLRAGGNWDRDILPMIEKYWGDFDVTICEFEE